jgi:hypothetical protein
MRQSDSGRRSGKIAVRRLALIAASCIAIPSLIVVPAYADTSPPAGVPATVSADALPTWQLNGVVWSQVIVGNTVYVAGNFTAARPPGSAPGVNQIAANDVFAYDVRTGNPVSSFKHQLNGQAQTVSASPDGTRVYIGGNFTTVDGQVRSHIAAFDTATNALSTAFVPTISSTVYAIAATNTTVYAGGAFGSANSKGRSGLAAFGASNGSLLSWAPSKDSGSVKAMVMAPDATRVIVGGQFTLLNGVDAYGMGSLDAVTGATLPWAANQRIRNAGINGAIDSLATDGTQIFGSGWAYGTGASFEGDFGADPNTGAINFVDDCHGDTYSVFPVGRVLYSVGHRHTCEWIGAFKQTNPWSYHRAVAVTTYPTGVNTGPDDYGWDYSGLPSASPLNWWPDVALGTFTGQFQGAWSVTGNSNYIVLGGEFPTVNGTAQQGLVRFATPAIAPNKSGPVASSVVAPSALSISKGTARLTWPAAWDRDNGLLTYNLLRDGSTTPIYTTTMSSTFWNLPVMHFVDTGLSPGSVHTYKLQVVDPFGNKTTSAATPPLTITSVALSQYAQDVLGDNASNYWRLGEPSGTTGNDYAGYTSLTEATGVGHGAVGAIIGDPDAASTFDGTTNGVASTTTAVDGPNLFSVEAWFSTTTTAGGKILGFGDASSGESSSYDRQIYMDNSGHIVFGVYNNGVYSIQSAKTYNDGSYHHVVGTLSPAGLILYIDGKRVGTNGGTTVGQTYTGYWRVGEDNLGGWPSQPTSSAFAGSIDDVAVYPAALTISQVQKHYVDSGRALSIPAVPADSYGKAVYNAQPDLYWRLDELAGTTAADTSPNGNDGVYAGGYTQGQPSPVSGPIGTAVAFDGSSGTIGSAATVNDPSTYTESAWFNTTTTHGGKIIGFGNQQSGNSSNYDRHVYMENSGQLTFGVWTGTTNTATSSSAYNDGKWHQMVATQGFDGMKLYVDGQLVATNAQTQSQSYTGYWRVGGDSDWGGDSAYLNGTIDEVAVWNSADLSAAQILAIYQASPAATSSNIAPTAVIAAPACTNLACTFDGSGSSDPDGTVASYAWNFGDGTTGTGATPAHTYTTAGTYTVSLVVTDNLNATSATATKSVTVTQLFALDAFARTVASGWGTALLGGPWSTSNASVFSVGGGVGTLALKTPGSGASIYLNAVSSNSTDVQVSVTTDKAATGGGIYANVVGRRIAGVGDYRAKVRLLSTGAVGLSLARVGPTGTETVIRSEINVAGLTYAPGTVLRIRLQVTGTNPTTVRARVWKVGTTEPTTWTVSVSDSTASFQAPGSVGINAYLSGSANNAPVVESYDDFQAGPAS